jgi:hypothetical protein
MSLSSWDDFPVHQTAEYIAHPQTSDRNFYDRYYFNLHGSSDELFAVFGLGQYPNLGVTDTFLCVATAEEHRVVRASMPLTDRSQLQIGPIRIEVLEPLRRLRYVCEPNEFGLAADLEWNAKMAAVEEPRQQLSSHGKMVYDTQRFTQAGTWEGSLTFGDSRTEVTPDRWQGIRDRSWGVRPVGEPQTDGIRDGVNVMGGMWNHFPMSFDDHTLLYQCHERNDGERPLEEGRRVWSDPERPDDHLGRPEYSHRFHSGTRVLAGSTITFPDAPDGPLSVECTPLCTNYIGIGTGYGLDADWRHGMYQGPEVVVQGVHKSVAEIAGLGQYGPVDQAARFEYEGNVGYGLYEHGFFGPFDRCGLADGAAVAP